MPTGCLGEKLDILPAGDSDTGKSGQIEVSIKTDFTNLICYVRY